MHGIAESADPGEPSRQRAEKLGELERTVRVALNRGDVQSARTLIAEAIALDLEAAASAPWAGLRDMTSWPDAWLVAAISADSPDQDALDELAQRHWRSLYGRCRMLTPDREEASDLAQAAWCRVLRSRSSLRADGNFPAYLATVATNLWRDNGRKARRSGALAHDRLVSLDADVPTDEGTPLSLADLVPDLNALEAQEQRRLMSDVDDALSRLAPLLREVLLARFLGGESCAEIARRHGKTEQTVSGWVRLAVRETRNHLSETRREGAGKEQS